MGLKKVKREEYQWEKLMPRIVWQFLRKGKKGREYVSQIYPQGNTEVIFSRMWAKRMVCAAIVLLLALFVFLLECFAEPSGPAHLQGRYLTRGEGEEIVELEVEGIPDSVSDSGEKSILQESLSLEIGEREFTEEEMRQLSDKTRSYLAQILPGKNNDLEHVTQKLNLVTVVPETGISIEWSYDDELFTDSGGIRQDGIPAAGKDTELQAHAVCKNWKESFTFPVHVIKRTVSQKKETSQNIKKVIREAVRKQADQEMVELPAEADGYTLQYQEHEETGISSACFIFLLLALLPLLWHQKQKKELEKRKTQLLLDYPVFMNRVMLLLGAGLTVRTAMERLATEYKGERKKGGDVRFVYEEVCVMSAQMREGVSESKAIELFGRRCRELPYLRFSSVLTQNLRKGAEGVLDILERESIEAMEKRKEKILQLGEVAGTKLLFPMMLMLGIVMGIIMVPAFMTM